MRELHYGKPPTASRVLGRGSSDSPKRAPRDVWIRRGLSRQRQTEHKITNTKGENDKGKKIRKKNIGVKLGVACVGEICES